jgi:two-component system sensor histidine kinase ChiS
MTDTKFILVVEDDPILKNLLGHTFAGKYQALYASDGNEALGIIEQYHPSLVLLDLMLPSMDGFAVLENIRSRTDDLKSVPVIIVSNLGQQSDVERAKSLGANEYLVKAEVPIEDIIAKIEALLPKSADAPAPEAVPAPAATPEVPPATV